MISLSTRSFTMAVLRILSLSFLFTSVFGHGFMCEPPQRGVLGGSKFASGIVPDPNAPDDPFAHFPAGNKATFPGAGKQSQERAGGFNWMPFKPMEPGFRWRAGVCGDEKGKPQDHLRGGKYYYGAKIVETYTQGGILDAKVSVVAHHNGFVELHVCNVAKCNGEISEACFKQGHCKQLEYVGDSSCNSRQDKKCPPRDPNYPGRWYMPCSRFQPGVPKQSFEIYDRMRFRLPDNLHCEHCVLHFFWTSANNCNPPGVKEFFQNERTKPSWGTCIGQAGAIGGYTNVQKDCGGRIFPEEYYQCADITIKPRGARSGPRPGGYGTSAPATTKPSGGASSGGGSSSGGGGGGRVGGYSGGKGVFKYLQFYADNGPKRRLFNGGGLVHINVDRWSAFSFRAVVSRNVRGVSFYLNGKLTRMEGQTPYFMFGDRGADPHRWHSPIFNTPFTVEARADGESIKVQVKLIKTV